MNNRDFTVDVNEKELALTVIMPSSKDQKEAGKVYNTAFTEALKSKAVVRARLDDLLVDQGLWDETKQQKFDTLQKEIFEAEKKLAKGGISLQEARDIALDMRKNREEIRDLISVKTNLDVHTAEGQADNAKFNYLVYACTVYKDNKNKFFNSYEDYLERSSELVAIKAAQNLANMIYGLEADYESKLPENKFLKNYKFIDDKLRLINKDGKLVDIKGRLVDENGRLINEEGRFVDRYGDLITEDGDYYVKFSPFLDEDGNAVVINEESNESVVDPIEDETVDKTEEVLSVPENDLES